MKKFKKLSLITILLVVLTLSKSIVANPYPPGSQQWHNYNGAMWYEQERIRAEREREAIRQKQLRQQQLQQLQEQNSKNNIKRLEEKYEEMKKQYGHDNPLPNEDVYAMILIDQSNGNVSWNLRFFETKRADSDKIALSNMKNYFFRNDFKYKPEQFTYFYFTLGETYAVARGQDKKTKQWDIWVMPKGNKKISQKELEREAIEFCNQEGNNCEIILSTTISKRMK